VRSFYGPLAPHVNAALFRLWGVSVSVLAAAGLVCGAVLAALAYRTVRLFAGRGVATAAAIAVLQVDVFVQLLQNNIFNFVVPYSYDATYGMTLAVASVLFLARHARTGARRDVWAAAALLGAVSMAKLEPLFAACVAHALHLAWRVAVSRRNPGRAILFPYVVSLAVAGAVYAMLHARVGPSLWPDQLFIVSNATAGNYALQHAGLDDWRTSLGDVLLSSLGLAVCLSSAHVLLSRSRDGGVAPWRLAVAGAVVIAVTIALEPFRQLLMLPAALLVACAFALRSAWASRQPDGPDVAFAVLCTFGLGGLPRILLHASAEHYGFYLLVPGVLAFAILIGARLPGHRRGSEAAAARVLACVWLLAVAASHARETQSTAAHMYGADLVRAGTARGSLPIPIPYRGTVDKAIRFLEEQAHDSRVLVVPEGVGITFLAGQRNAWGLHTILPTDVSGGYDDAHLLAEVRGHPPDFVVETAADTTEYGKKGFGIDYAQQLAQWLHTHYGPLRTWQSPYYAVVVYGRREAVSRSVSDAAPASRGPGSPPSDPR
jgi:hypothetical protein